jgi:diguanylate cyclase (GGDEF)-like protein
MWSWQGNLREMEKTDNHFLTVVFPLKHIMEMKVKSPTFMYIDVQTFKIRIRKLKWFAAAPIAFLFVAIVGIIDFFLDPETTFSIFYLLPITIAVFLSGRVLGIITSLLSIFFWLAGDFLSGWEFLSLQALSWNVLVLLGFYLLHTFIISWLLKTIKDIRVLSLRDPLTGAANWRYFREYADRMIKNSLRNKSPLTLVYVDLDNFKRLNDISGHAAGDEALRTVAGVIRRRIRPGDILARLGGDEFGLLLVDSSYGEAGEALSRIVEAVNLEIEQRDLAISLSVGAMTYRVPLSSLDAMITEVDELMYKVKQSGKNDINHIEARE